MKHYLKNKRRVLYLPEELVAKLEARAKQENKSLSLLVYEILQSAIQ